ncbi:TetR/AcrR family transcriptional regulator [Streptomyces tubbatahanensis]|uniref:TetR/AcrR family transcriptional regulator n=1 Tax=Streptomyces tubbatahanensis TaxID=2923272 RepID=A0ABY3Y1A6_9ACTN|nr:TetR/AcrR family transcriptional regulator [Streptomyces tubbatahanensis]UNT00054.1 TetR/AcrR family transcriptional regulator [Streptomyces tubbatahanensis]
MNDEKLPSTRERILAAAAAILAEDGLAARLSVRAVAARAGVSSGSLRHHFPTQRDLRDEVTHRIFDWVARTGRIDDASRPARDRLVECLSGVLAAAGTGPQAREALATAVRTFVTAEQTEQVRASYLAIERDTHHRVESWLTSLAEEGALAGNDIPRSARFLSTVVNGLAFERAMPAQDALTERERETLHVAVDAVLRTRA